MSIEPDLHHIDRRATLAGLTQIVNQGQAGQANDSVEEAWPVHLSSSSGGRTRCHRPQAEFPPWLP